MYSLAINSAYGRNIVYLPSQLDTGHISNTAGTLKELCFKLGIKFVDTVLLLDKKNIEVLLAMQLVKQNQKEFLKRVGCPGGNVTMIWKIALQALLT